MSANYYTSMRNVYRAIGKWGADGLEPVGIGARVRNMLEQTSHLVPPGQQWFLLDLKKPRYSPAANPLTGIIRSNRIPGDFNESDPPWGYAVSLITLTGTEDQPTSGSIQIDITAGSNCLNKISFEIGGSDFPPDYSCLTYQAYRDMIGAIAEAWPCPWIFAYNSRSPRVHPPADLAVNGPVTPPFGGAWIVYLSAPLAKGLAPPPELVSEPTAGGGLFLSTTRTLLDQSSADEMRRSRLLAKIALERIGSAPGGAFPASPPARVGPA